MKLDLNKKILSIAVIGGIACSTSVYAATTNINAVANFLTAITLGNEADIDFGTIEYSAVPGAGDTASLGTNGAIAYAGNFSGAGTGTAGSVDVTAGTDTSTIEIFCETSATMTDGAGASIDVVGIEVVPETGATGAYGSGTACAGLGVAATTMALDIGGGTGDTFYFGGQLDGSTAASFVAASYSTANAGGSDIQIDVYYQ